jgi:hypothetical protein
MNAFWAWQLADDEGSVCICFNDEFAGMGSGSENLAKDSFKHIFGLLPAEGQAIQIDPSVWGTPCSGCAEIIPLGRDEEPGICPLCGCSLPPIYHAHIVEVKNLEEAKP